MSPLRARRHRLAAEVTAVVAAVALAVVLSAALSVAAGVARADVDSGEGVDLDTDLDEAVESDDEVDRARERLDAARDGAAALAEQLQEAAARYERARAHRLRLEAEAEEAAEAVAAAERAVDTARTDFAQTVVASYKRPGTAVGVSEAVLTSTSRQDALHRAALVDRAVVGEQRHTQRLASQADRVAQARRQHQTLQAGVAGAAADAEEAAGELETASRAAREEAEQAAEELAAASERARERIAAEREAERRRLAEQRQREQRADRAARVGGRGRTVLPPEDAFAGMACPVAEPNSFIDSWHFPRSGGRVHLGVDIFADHGMPVHAVADGTVRRAWHNRLGGLSIDLIDDRGDRYYYAHLSATHVTTGDRVSAGEHIADNGNSGNARHTPPHLHWQYHPGDGDAVNPYPLAAALCR